MLLYNLQLQSYTRDIKKGYIKTERIFGFFLVYTIQRMIINQILYLLKLEDYL